MTSLEAWFIGTFCSIVEMLNTALNVCASCSFNITLSRLQKACFFTKASVIAKRGSKSCLKLVIFVLNLMFSH